MNRTPTLQKFLDGFAEKNFGHKQGEKGESGKSICVFCGAEVDASSFKDELSVKEFHISGVCQKCQDETFG